mgnify:CR=1 FL=1
MDGEKRRRVIGKLARAFFLADGKATWGSNFTA